MRIDPRSLPALAAVCLLLAALVAGCAGYTPPGGTRAAGPERGFTILAINDIYRIEGVDGGLDGGLARVRSLRRELERDAPDLLLLHAGDMLFPSLPSRLYQGGQMIDVLNLLDGEPEAFDERMFATFGNHEFDEADREDAAIVRDRVKQSEFRWLASDIDWIDGADGRSAVAAENLLTSALVTSGGVRVGLFSLTTDEKQPAYVEEFRDPVTVAREATARLRDEGAEVVVALTHLSLAQDTAVLSTLGDAGPDLVIGGHEHNRIHQEVAGRWILKADAEARTATEVRVTPHPGGPPEVRFTYHELGSSAPADPAVGARVEEWLARFDREYCAAIARGPRCLDEVVGATRVELVGEELEIRRFETNYGDWILDQALGAFAVHGAQIAFVNAGSLRLNHNVPPGDVVLAHIEETFQYPSDLVLLEIKGSVLQEIVSHAVTDWTGAGKWLQIAGFAFRHDPETGSASELTLLAPEGPRRIGPDDEILAVTNDFLADPETGQDGYVMISRDLRVPVSLPVPSLRELVLDALAEAGAQGIAPAVEGRICNAEREGPCLAVGAEDGR